MTEHITMRVDWEEVQGAIVTEVLGLNSTRLNDGSAQWDEVAICLGDKALRLTLLPESDQFIASLEDMPSGKGWAPIPSFAFAHGQELTWCWIGINYLGYKDAFTVAFGGDDLSAALMPRCMFYAVAGWIYCYDLTRRMA